MISTMDEEENLGDIFWDLPTWVHYTTGYDLGCIIYVANPTDTEKEYALISRTYRNKVPISEGALQVHGYTWFAVSPGDFIKLHGTIVLGESDVTLTVSLVEKVTQEATDSISTVLVTPTAAILPPSWPIPGVDNLMSLLIMVMIIAMMGKMMSSALKTEEDEKELEPQEA